MATEICEIVWHSPLDAVSNILHFSPETSCCLLFSGMHTSYSGRYSYVAWQAEEEINTDAFASLSDIEADITPLPHWFGNISYEAGCAAHNVPATSASFIVAPLVAFIRYAHVIRYDHQLQRCHYHGESPDAAHPFCHPSLFHFPSFPSANTFVPHLSKSHYLSIIRETIAEIHAGNFYQANITCKYSGELSAQLTACSAWEGFMQLHQLSPAPYSAFFSRQGRYILSSSPELFIQIDDAGYLTTRPIKGTLSADQSAHMLHNSYKNKAENLMIVDLMRNDLAACALAGSVQVPHLWEVDSFRTLHHLSSTIAATLPPSYTLTDVLHATFPAGSMTGAPKRAAMQWIAAKEGIDRGIYSGALGWINGKCCELSVVIRTLIAEENRYEFQVGGGIVADSDPEEEYAETLTKARALLTLLQHNLPKDV
jgi:para-aminobenzoate synthetase component 1